MKISEEVLELKEILSAHKRFFHANPEIGFAEYKTSAYIAQRLHELGFEVRENIAQTGVMGLLRGQGNAPCIMFRADMDAVLTNSDDPNSARHACGHDAHMAILLSLAELLSQKKDTLKGTVKLVFQPGEESFGGAAAMIDQGILEQPAVDKAFALHVWSEIEEGKIGNIAALSWHRGMNSSLRCLERVDTAPYRKNALMQFISHRKSLVAFSPLPAAVSARWKPL